MVIHRLQHQHLLAWSPASFYVPGSRAFSKIRKKAQPDATRNSARKGVKKVDKAQAETPVVAPGVTEDFVYKAPKTVIIRLVACAAAAQVRALDLE